MADRIIETRVRAVVAREFNVTPEQISPDLAMGEIDAWDSLGHLTLMMAIEREFGRRFTTEQIAQPRSVPEIVTLVETVLAYG